MYHDAYSSSGGSLAEVYSLPQKAGKAQSRRTAGPGGRDIPRLPLVADVDVAGLLVEEAILGLLLPGLRVVGLLLALRLPTNPRHGSVLDSPTAGAGLSVVARTVLSGSVRFYRLGSSSADQERSGDEDPQR